ncbi:3-hydroxyisobutyrate dehydrogenase-like beta-hydroxyacid dehydrogenase [Lipingzhangella halophila]|uniref:3-hydroxyisobutyrate dehydrogenase-like beta-hydroxyacid dehydrogenase n=1 Tax=Lipingzhangella halophila TaxID=1783352 RepID=A0A7W7W0E1_9ACTN|nr:NAD(P)-binding domain-containing protein [Lipingzhangella halophila]MBB4929817.1 3-hydroxyisobutyrate dehydrogenase-like beta-hydroxyacid dehydrogenase [Lipingzhangella halophila]
MASQTNPDVTIIGLGLMGRALAGALLKAGHQVTVWNRTAAKAEELLAQGALLADSANSAVTASPVTITCVADYPSLQQAFAPVSDELDGRLLVNLTSGDSAQARDMARWTEQRGAHYLDGAIMAVPPTIGTADAVILLSGSKTAFDSQRSVLDALGTATHLGADHGLSALYDVAGLSMMWGVLNAWLQGVALLATAGIDASTYTPFAVQMAQGTAGWLEGYADQVDSGTYPPDDATLATHAGGMAHLVEESERLGVNAELPRLFKSLVDRAITAGQAGKSYPALVEQFNQESRTS